MSDAVFHAADTPLRFVATDVAAGPWDAGSCHGGAPAGLVMQVADAQPAPSEMRIARLTLELLKPVPVAALDARVDVLREGRKVQLLEVTLSADGRDVARGRVLRIRSADMPLPISEPGWSSVVPQAVGPEEAKPTGSMLLAGFANAFERRTAHGAFGQGPAAVWFRNTLPLVAGTPLGSAARAAMVADFGNGISAGLPFDQWLFLNADLTVNILRDIEGPWILADSVTHSGPEGRASTLTRLLDARGVFATAAQNLLLEPRAGN
jgi:hypothetical protein